MKVFEIVCIENGIYYINYFSSGIEYPAIKLKLCRDDFYKWQKGKLER